MGTWKTIEHTADLALEAEGESPEEALEALCRGLLVQITEPEAVNPGEERKVEVEGFDEAEALVGFLNEILYLVNAEHWLPARVEVARARGARIVGTARGEPFDPDRHPFDLEVKAATYHDLHWGPDPSSGRWRARVVFDV